MNILAALAARIGSKALLWAGAVIVGLGVISGLYLSVKRCGRMEERFDSLKRADKVKHEQLKAALRRPRSRGELADRLRDGSV